MKKLFLVLILPILIFSCSTDDAEDIIITPDVLETGLIRITQVDAQQDIVVLTNLGTNTTDVSNYFLCLGPGTYVRVADATSNPTNLAPSQSVSLSYDVDEAADGLSIFSTNTFSSTDPNVLLDYIQWGAGNQARVDQAVTAGRWDNANNFLAVGASYNFTGEADEFGSTFYETVAPEESTPIIRILQVDAQQDLVWLSNFGTETVDVGDYFLCLGPGTYVRVSDATNNATEIAPGANLMLSYDVNPTADGLSIFSTNTFGSSDPSILLDYVQWGAGNQARVNQAVTAGRWDNANNFVPMGSPYTFNGEAEQFGSTFWDSAEPSTVVRISAVNSSTDQVTLQNFGNVSVDVGTYWLCLGPGTYVRVSDATSSSTTLAPGSSVVLDYDVNETVDGLSVFSTNTFGSSDPSILLDYVQWGAGNQARVNQAVTAGRWDNANNFVNGGPAFSFSGNADDFGSTFW